MPTNWEQYIRDELSSRAVDPDDKAIVDAAAILAAGHKVRFVFTMKDGAPVDVRAEKVSL